MKIKNFLSSSILLAGDFAMLILAFYFAYWIRADFLPHLLPFLIKPGVFFPVSHFYKFLPILFIYILFFFYEKIYYKRYTFWVEFVYILRGLFISTILIVFFIYFLKGYGQFARTIIVFMFLSAAVFIPLLRYILKFILFKTGLFKHTVGIIINDISVRSVYQTLTEVWYLGYSVKGVIGQKKIKSPPLKFLGYIKDLEEIIDKCRLDGLIIMEEGFSKSILNRIIAVSEAILPDIKIIPDSLALKTIGVQPEYVNELLLLNLPNNLASPVNKILKTLFDITGAFIIILFLLPLFCIVAVLIKINSPGPVFYSQERIGHKGKLFKFYKFRSMYIDGDQRIKSFINKHKWAKQEWQKYQKLKSADPRVTAVGRFLRRFSIDEMPQIFNVFLGNMSIIGPRPYLPREKVIIGRYASVISKVKPGLTGLWQIRGRNTLSFNTRLRLDEFYVRNWSFFLDFMILAKTLKVVLTGEGAY